MLKFNQNLILTIIFILLSTTVFSNPTITITPANHLFRIDAAIEAWTDTGLDINQDEEFIFWADGCFHMRIDSLLLYANHWLTPHGSLRELSDNFDLGTLIAKIGIDGEPFPIREFLTFKAKVSGRLYLKLYDGQGKYYNNQGFANVLVYGPIQRSISTQFESTYNSTEVEDYTLSQNYPNPFNPTCTINYGIQHAGDVGISIYNSLGQKVKTLVNEFKTPGEYSVIWNGTNNDQKILSSGQYYYRLKVGDFISSKKMILLK